MTCMVRQPAHHEQAGEQCQGVDGEDHGGGHRGKSPQVLVQRVDRRRHGRGTEEHGQNRCVQSKRAAAPHTGN